MIIPAAPTVNGIDGWGVSKTVGMEPIMQLAFYTVRFDPKTIRHQHLMESARVLRGRTIPKSH